MCRLSLLPVIFWLGDHSPRRLGPDAMAGLLPVWGLHCSLAGQARLCAVRDQPAARRRADLDAAACPKVSSSGQMTGGNPEAAADPVERTKEFLEARLKSKLPDATAGGTDRPRCRRLSNESQSQ